MVFLHWDICPAGEHPDFTNRIHLRVLGNGELFLFEHSNSSVGIWSWKHCLRNATVIDRRAFGSRIDGEKVTLASAVRQLLKTARPNHDDPT